MSHTILRSEILPRLQRVKPEDGAYRASCPVPGHGKGRGDRIPSFTIGVGHTQPIVYKCHAGCDQDNIKDALIDLGVNWELVTTASANTERTGEDTWIACGWDHDRKKYDLRHRRVAEYQYHDTDGRLIFTVARCALKGDGCQGFRQWRPDPTSGTGKKWSRRLPDGTKVGEGLPYRLPDIRRAIREGRTVWVCEGEADCDRLAELGHAATCNAEGAGKWTTAHALWLAGADVVVVGDRDEVGWAHAERVINTLLPVVASIEFVRAAEGKDVRDHLNAGLTLGQFVTVDVPKPPQIPDNVINLPLEPVAA